MSFWVHWSDSYNHGLEEHSNVRDALDQIARIREASGMMKKFKIRLIYGTEVKLEPDQDPK